MSDPKNYRNILDLDQQVAGVDVLSAKRDELLAEILAGDHVGPTVYSGKGGIAALYVRLFETWKDPKYLTIASDWLQKALVDVQHERTKNKHQLSFVEGYAGTYSLATVIKFYEKDYKASDAFKEKLLLYFDVVLDEGNKKIKENEVLYGRAGFIHALLYCHQRTRDVSLLVAAEKVTKFLVKEGHLCAQRVKSRSPLMYEWHDKRYTGFAHGLCGIFFVIMAVNQILEKAQIKEVDGNWWSETMKEVREGIKFVASTAFPGGNYPTRDDGVEDKLVQWCHGAPAATLLFCKAFEIFGDQRYLQLALSASEVVWTRGLLRKGYGLCHGVAGNAYCFLYLYKLTKQEVYLTRSIKFCTFGWDDEEIYNALREQPDEPLSLYNGAGGLAYLCNDLVLLLKGEPVSYVFPTLEFE